jgi:hypothetical protein
MPLRYPCIICPSFEHCVPYCLRKIEVQNMFQTKPNTIITIVAENPKPNNVPINVVAAITTHNQAPE